MKNAPPEFLKVMDQVLYGLPFARCYKDDVIIFSITPQEHVRHMQAIFKRLQRWELRLHHGKCKFFHDWLAYLGHMIVPGGLGVQQAKVYSLQKIPALVDVSRFHVFLGLANYYRQFVKNFSLIAKPFTILTSNGQPWTWGREQQQAFETLKQKLGTALVLRRPDVSNLSSCIRTRAYWVWEQFSLRKMTLAGNILLLTHRKATTRRRPIIPPMREKHWRRCGLLPISGHTSMVSALLW